MNPINSINSNVSSADTANRSDQLGQEQFLELLVAQLENQDPSSPMENGEFLSQIAQFSMVSGIGELETSMAAMAESTQRNQISNAASLLDKQVLYSGDQVYFNGSNALTASVTLAAPAESLRLNVVNTEGNLVDSVNLGAQGAGQSEVRWDGVLADGSRAAPGQYSIYASSLRNGVEEVVPVQLYDQVEALIMNPNGSQLQLQLNSGNQIPLSSVQQIR